MLNALINILSQKKYLIDFLITYCSLQRKIKFFLLPRKKRYKTVSFLEFNIIYECEIDTWKIFEMLRFGVYRN